MLFWLARSAARGLGKSGNRGARPAQPNPAPASKGGRGAIIAVIAVCIVMSLILGTPNLLWMAVIPVIAIPPVWFIAVLWPAWSAESKVAHMPSLASEQHKTMEIQQRVQQLEAGPSVPSARVPPAATPTQTATQETTTVVPVPRRTITLRDALTDDELTERMTRVAAILMATCPVCDAGEAEFCTYVADVPVVMLDSERSILAHGARIGMSMKNGWAKPQDVVAQFGNNVPDEVWQEAL